MIANERTTVLGIRPGFNASQSFAGCQFFLPSDTKCGEPVRDRRCPYCAQHAKVAYREKVPA